MANLTIKDVRTKFPQYNDLDDTQLADALHQKFYADMDRTEFDAKIGLAPVTAAPTAPAGGPAEFATQAQDMTFPTPPAPRPNPRTPPMQPPAPAAGTLPQISIPAPAQAVPPRSTPANPVLQTQGPGPGGGMTELYDAGILPRRYADDPLAAAMTGGAEPAPEPTAALLSALGGGQLSPTEQAQQQYMPVDLAAAMAPPKPPISPFDPARHKPRDNGDGSFSTEIQITSNAPEGGYWNIPSLWWTDAGEPVELDERAAVNLAKKYEADTGLRFPRFASIEDAVTVAKERSSGGGATHTKLASEPARQPISDMAKRAARGVTEIGASVPETLGILQSGGVEARIEDTAGATGLRDQQIADIQTRLADPNLTPQERAFRQQQLADLQQGQGVVADQVAGMEQRAAIPTEDRPIYQKGEAIRQASQNLFGTPDPQFDERFMSKLSEGAGNMAGFVATTLLTGVLGGAAAGSSLNTSGMYRRAKQDGATEEQARTAAYIGSIVGASEVIPIGRAFDMLPSATRNRVANVLGRRLSNIFATAGEEGVQEAVAEIANNLTEKFIWNPDQNVFEGAGESALIGAILGGGVGAIAGPQGGQDAARVIRERGQEEPPQDMEPPVPQTPPTPPAPQAPPQAPRQAPDAPAQPDPLVNAMQPQGPAPDLAAAMAPEQNVQNGQNVQVPQLPATQGDEGGQFEVMDETETVNGESVPTGRKVRVNLDTGQVSPVEPETAPDQRDAVQSQPQGAPAVGSVDAPVAGDAADLTEGGHFDIQDELETVNGVTRPTGRKVRTDLETGDMDIVDPGAQQEPAQGEAQTVAPVADQNQPDPAPQTALPAVGDTQAQPQIARAPARDQPRDVAVTPAGREVDVEYAVVEADDLVSSNLDDGRVNPDYPQTLQPRDRTRPASQEQVRNIARNLDARLLGRSPSTTDGAPIIAPSGIVESGNGRIMGIRQAYQTNPEGAERYRQSLAQQGYDVGRFRNPVLVRVRQTDMSPEDLSAYTRESNERTTSSMSATERAMADAQSMPDSILSLYRGGDLDTAQNRQFVRQFLKSAVSNADAAQMIDAQGEMSQEAVRRVQAALLAKAYGDADLVAALVESSDSDIKAIGGALTDVAAQWAQMRAEARGGQIAAEMDQTDALLEAVRIVNRARQSGRNVAEFVGQGDLLSGGASISDDGKDFLALFFRDKEQWTRPAGRGKISDALRFFVEEAQKTAPSADMFGAGADPQSVVRTARERQYGDEGQQDSLFRQAASGDGAGVRSNLAGQNPDRGRADAGAASSGQDAQPGQGDQGRPEPDVTPDAEPQGEAGTYVRRTTSPDDNRFKDRSAELPDRIPVDQLAQEAKRLTLEPGKRDDIEYLMMIDAAGRIVAYGSGIKTGTGVPSAFDLLENSDERIIAHHNHPSSNGFSPADIAIALTPAMDGMYAHAHDGSTFFARSTATGLSMWQTAPSPAMRHTTIFSDLDNAMNNMWLKAQPHIQPLVNSGFYPKEPDQTRENYIQPGRDRSFAFMMALRDAGIIEMDVTGPAADRFTEDGNPFLFDPELRKLYDNLVRTLKTRVKGADTEGNYDRPAATRRHPGELAAASRPADDDQASDADDRGSDPQRENRDQDENRDGDGGTVQGASVSSAAISTDRTEVTTLPSIKDASPLPFGPTSIRPRPIADGKKLYRETDVEALDDILRVDGQPSTLRTFVTDNRDLAIGQGNNNGVMLTFRPDSLSGEVNQKPGTSPETGLEYRTDMRVGRAVEAVEVDKSTLKKLRSVTARVLNREFERSEEGNTVIFTRKGFRSDIASLEATEPDAISGPEAVFQSLMPGASAVTPQAAKAIIPKLRNELDRLNLKRVSVRLGDMRKFRQGAFVFDGLGAMDILIEQSANPEKTLYHESIHAMRHLDLFTSEEWDALTREARGEWIRKHDINARYPHLTEAERIEEAVAEEFAERAASREAPQQGPIRRAMRKIHRLLRAIRAAITGRSAEDIFDDAFEGRIGMRDAGSTGNMLTLNPEVGVREQVALFQMGRKSKPKPKQKPKPKPKERDGTFKADTIAHVNALNAKYGPGKTPEQPGLPAVFNMPERRGATKVREWFQDRFLMFEAAERAIASGTGQAVPEGISFRMKQNLFDGRSASRLESVIRDEVRPLTDAMRAEKVSLDDLGVYLLAKHAPERNALMAKRNPERFGKDGGSGLYNEAAKEIIQDFKDRGMIERLEKVAKLARSIISRDLKLRRDAGLLSQEQFESYRDMYENYVPLRGAAERDDGGQIGRIGKGFDIRGKEVKEALGRQSLSENPVVQLIAMRQEGVVRSEKNRATRALFATVQKYPNPEVWETIGKLPTRETLNPDTGTVQKVPDFGALREDDVVGVKVQGETYYMRIKDPLMAEAVKNLTYQSQNTWARFFYNLGRITRTWSRLQTGANPNFVFPNGMSDFLEGIWTAYNADKKRMMRSYAKNYPIAMYYGVTSEFGDSWVGRKLSNVQKSRLKKLVGEDIGDTEIARFEKYRQEWEADGGRINFMAFRDLDEIARDITSVVEGADKSAIGRVASAGLEGAFAAVEKINQPVEMAGRLAMYVAGRENGMSREQAASMSLDASGNYYRRGTLTRGMSSMYAFFNPAVQGIEKFVRFAKRPRNQVMMAGLIASNWALTKLFMALYEDDEDPEGRSLYLDVPEYERNRSIIIPTGVSYETIKDEQGNPVMVRGDNGEMVKKQIKRLDYLSFRVPHNLRPLMALGQQLAILEKGFATPEEATHSISRSILMNTNPMGGETFMNMVAPTVLDPAVDLTQNRNWTGGPVYPEVERWTEGLPRSYDYWERSTSDPSVWIAQTLNGMSGGDRYNPGNIDIQPGQIDFIARFMIGGLGRFVQDSAEVTADLASGADVLSSDIPITKAVRNRTGYWPENDLYYKIRTEANENKNRLRLARRILEDAASTADQRSKAEAEYKHLLVEMNVGMNSNGNFNWTNSAPRVIEDADKKLKALREDLTLVVNSESLTRAERKKKSRDLRLRMEQVQIEARKMYLDRVAVHGAATSLP